MLVLPSKKFTYYCTVIYLIGIEIMFEIEFN